MSGVWRESGYADFADGVFGNGGHNIYVSRAGVLQRIFRYDFSGDGYFDLVFANSQDMDERPGVYVYHEPLGQMEMQELPTLGAYAGAIGDLNGDGYDDLVIGHQCDGSHSDLTAYIYHGSAEGLTERYKLELPAPNCRCVAIGDFNGNGQKDIAFGCNGKLRIFYQCDGVFRPSKYVELDIEALHITAGDFDGDGYGDLYVKTREKVIVLWGGEKGLDVNRWSLVGDLPEASRQMPSSTPEWAAFVTEWRTGVVELGGIKHLFWADKDKASLIPVGRDRGLGEALKFGCANAVAVAGGDINGDGYEDIVFAVCQVADDGSAWGYANKTEESCIYWGGANGYDERNKTVLTTIGARDVVVSDLDGNGYGDVVLCQGSTDVMHTTESLIFRGCADGVEREPVRLVGHDATTALVGKTSDAGRREVILINHVGGRVRGDVNVYVYHGGPDGYGPGRRTELPGRSAPDALACDFNDNGFADLFVSNCSENSPHLDPGSYLYWGGAGGLSKDNKEVFRTYRGHGSAVGDFRHSGYLDLAIVGFSNPELLIFRQGADGFDLENPDRVILDPNLKDYTARVELATGGDREGIEYREPRRMISADFNNNGWLDLFVPLISGPRSLILWGGPEGFSMERSSFLEVAGAVCAQCADLTGNGYLDLIVGGHQTFGTRNRYDSFVYIYWGGPGGFREDRRAQLPSHCSNSLTIADFNNNGFLDIFTVSYKDGINRDLDSYLYWGSEGGNYSVRNRRRFFTHSASGCMAVDLNENGWVDLIVANHKTYGNHVGESQIWWNSAEGFSEERRTFLPTLGPHGMLAVDPGNIRDRGAEEYYISSAYELPEQSRVKAIGWKGDVPRKTWVKGQFRFGATQGELENAKWQGGDGVDTWFENGQKAVNLAQSGQWVQYRLALGAINGVSSPRIREVEVFYD